MLQFTKMFSTTISSQLVSLPAKGNLNLKFIQRQSPHLLTPVLDPLLLLQNVICVLRKAFHRNVWFYLCCIYFEFCSFSLVNLLLLNHKSFL